MGQWANKPYKTACHWLCWYCILVMVHDIHDMVGASIGCFIKQPMSYVIRKGLGVYILGVLHCIFLQNGMKNYFHAILWLHSCFTVQTDHMVSASILQHTLRMMRIE